VLAVLDLVTGSPLGTGRLNRVDLDQTRTRSAIELAEVLDRACTVRIHAHVKRYPVEQAPEPYQRTREGSLSARAVVTPHR
jgi:D-arabinose 1-dehydrogenase-like Zn-dependent alcohol dehydrogenase